MIISIIRCVCVGGEGGGVIQTKLALCGKSNCPNYTQD